MLSEVKVKDIIFDERIREDYGEIEKLAESIDKHGIIHYPVVTPREDKYKLIAGGRRMTAIKKVLKWDTVTVDIRKKISKLTLKELELEENLQRKQLTWEEEVKAKEQIHALKIVSDSSWTIEDTAKLLNTSTGSLSMDIQLAKALKEQPELVKNKNKTDAFKQMKKEREDAIRRELASRLEFEVDETTLMCGDMLEIAPRMDEGCIDLIVTDPPWGSEQEKSETVVVEYDDSVDSMMLVVEQAYKEMYRTLKDGGHMFVFFGIQFMDWHIDKLTKAGFEVDALPGIWNKLRPGGMTSPYRESNEYETYLHCWKGDPLPLRTKVGNCQDFPRATKRIHSAEKPIELYEHFIKNASEPGDFVVDFFAGSGNVIKAALKLKREAWGCELDPVNHQKAVESLEDFMRELEVKSV